MYILVIIIYYLYRFDPDKELEDQEQKEKEAKKKSGQQAKPKLDKFIPVGLDPTGKLDSHMKSYLNPSY